MYLLDTNHCSRIIQGDVVLLRHIQNLGKVPVATSVIVCGELTFMAQNSQKRTANLIRVQVFLRGIDIYPIDRETADIYGQFKAEIITQFGPRERSRRKTPRLRNWG